MSIYLSTCVYLLYNICINCLVKITQVAYAETLYETLVWWGSPLFLYKIYEQFTFIMAQYSHNTFL